VERYIDTPVKRYSSGMYVRLAFAVAAHLEPDILIVDEVLAVGDAEFQKKCLGKMKNVSVKDGRTVLFVSHNMTALKTLCTRCMWLEKGLLKLSGETNAVVDKYLASHLKVHDERVVDCSNEESCANDSIKFLKVAVESEDELIRITDAVNIYFEFESYIDNAELNMSIVIYTAQEVCVFNSASKFLNVTVGRYYARCYIPSDFLNDETYKVRVLVVKDRSNPIIDINDIISFHVHDIKRESKWYGKRIGIVRPNLKWEFNQSNIIRTHVK